MTVEVEGKGYLPVGGRLRPRSLASSSSALKSANRGVPVSAARRAARCCSRSTLLAKAQPLAQNW